MQGVRLTRGKGPEYLLIFARTVGVGEYDSPLRLVHGAIRNTKDRRRVHCTRKNVWRQVVQIILTVDQLNFVVAASRSVSFHYDLEARKSELANLRLANGLYHQRVAICDVPLPKCSLA